MTEDQARQWIAERFAVSRETMERLEAYVRLLLEEAERQNLIAASTFDTVWMRHIVDSAQLLLHAPVDDGGLWVDVGSGAGLPGIVIAILSDWHMELVESRKGRIAFLLSLVEQLGLSRVRINGNKVERVTLAEPASIISARAYAPLDRLFETTLHLADRGTVWLLPKGKNCQNELDNTQPIWQGVFHVERSMTDAESSILIASQVHKRGRQK
jgi:16S rRNA (guanine527-N7)-methyltransferase